jgi:DNA-binding response OmpR family regulator
MAGDKRRVVLVDPHEAEREALALRLEAQLFEVHAFGDSAAAADWTLREPPDAVIADVWMPGISGVQL